jgi:Fe-S cluster biogenesis protein NfuA
MIASVLLIIAVVAVVFLANSYFGDNSMSSPKSISTTTMSAAPSTTTAPTKPPVEYHDVSRGGTYEIGDNVEFRGVKGTIVVGYIENGEATSYLEIHDLRHQELLVINPIYYLDHGLVKMIAFPQDGKTYLELNGKDSGCISKYYKLSSIKHYLTVFKDKNNPEYQKFLIKSC